MGLSDAEMIQGGYGGVDTKIDKYRSDPKNQPASEMEQFLGQALARGMTVQEAAIEYKLSKQGGNQGGTAGGMQPGQGMQTQTPVGPGTRTVEMTRAPVQGPAAPDGSVSGMAGPPTVTARTTGMPVGGGRGAMADMRGAGPRTGLSAPPSGMPPVETRADFEEILRSAPQFIQQQAARQPKRRSVEEELDLINARIGGQKEVAGVKGDEARKTAGANNTSRDKRLEKNLAAKKSMQEFGEGEKMRRLRAGMAGLLQRAKVGKADLSDRTEARTYLTTIANIRSNIARILSSNAGLTNDPEAADQISEWESEIDAYEEALNEIRASKGQEPINRKAGAQRSPKTGAAAAYERSQKPKASVPATPEEIDAALQGE